jgi:tRNA threonylcarbamoyl adenosine modification protein YjeE
LSGWANMAEHRAQSSAAGGVERGVGGRLKGAMGKDSQRFEGELALADLAATTSLGMRIAAGLTRGDCVALAGDLGAGKTTLARAILRALGVREPVPSPTFTLVQSYDTGRWPVRHYDFYRIENATEIAELGLDEALAEGAALVEWPERANAYIPEDALRVTLAIVSGEARSASVTGPARWSVRIGELGAHAG